MGAGRVRILVAPPERIDARPASRRGRLHTAGFRCRSSQVRASTPPNEPRSRPRITTRSATSDRRTTPRHSSAYSCVPSLRPSAPQLRQSRESRRRRVARGARRSRVGRSEKRTVRPHPLAATRAPLPRRRLVRRGRRRRPLRTGERASSSIGDRSRPSPRVPPPAPASLVLPSTISISMHRTMMRGCC